MSLRHSWRRSFLMEAGRSVVPSLGPLVEGTVGRADWGSAAAWPIMTSDWIYHWNKRRRQRGLLVVSSAGATRRVGSLGADRKTSPDTHAHASRCGMCREEPQGFGDFVPEPLRSILSGRCTVALEAAAPGQSRRACRQRGFAAIGVISSTPRRRTRTRCRGPWRPPGRTASCPRRGRAPACRR